MTIGARKEYLRAIRERYFLSSKSEKGEILNEFCLVCGYTRKYAMRVISKGHHHSPRRKGPPVVYNDEFILHLAQLWQAMGNPCSKKMVAAIKIWLPFYRAKNLTEEIKKLLLRVSSATIDRCLEKFKEQRGLSSTKSSYFKSQIPLKLIDEDQMKTPGFMEADTVAHCGTSLSGPFVSTLTMTDLCSGWTETRACQNKEAYHVVRAVIDIEEAVPFNLRGFASDNGTEFLNEQLNNYFKNRSIPVEFIRRRPYKKNDNAHVEQKNFTHVREIFGYERIVGKELTEMMNDIYKNYWNPLQNYFTPCMKLKSKTRVGSKIVKKYDEAKTPYQRLLESKNLRLEREEAMRREFESLNPFKMRKILDQRLTLFYKLLDDAKRRIA